MTNWISHTIEPWMPAGALKAKADYAEIACQSGFSRLAIARYNDQRFSAADRTAKINDWLFDIKTGDLVVHQFPTYMSADFEAEWQASIQARGAKYILLVHDFEPFRVNKTNPTEFTLADNADLIVSHSNKMTQAFVNRGIQTPTVVQPLFDYLGPNPPLANYSQQINFAGTFQKSPWLHDYQGPALTLFGARPKKWQEWVVPPTINWQGNLDPDEITAVFKTGFGLIWDSDFDDKSYQSYTKLNAPHKASLYLKAGLPLIAWDQSHIGRLIQAHNLGFTISSLADLDSILSQVTVDQYQDWQKNLVPWRDKVATGGFTEETLQAVLEYFKS